MLGALCRRNDGGIHHDVLELLAQSLRAFFHDARHSRARLRADALIEVLEHLLEPRHVLLGLIEVRVECIAQLRAGGAL